MTLPGSDVTVELSLNGAWVDVTSYVRAMPGIRIDFGIKAENAIADPAEARLQLDNRDARFSPKNAEGPYYGYLKRNTPLRVTVGSTVRYVGEVAEFPGSHDPAGADVIMDVSAAGPLRRLTRGDTLAAPMNLAIQDLTRVLGEIVGYWPMDEPGGTFASGLPSGNPAVITSGTPEYAAYDPPDYKGSAPIAKLNTGVRVDVSATGGSGTEGTAGLMVGFPDAGFIDETEIFRFWTGGSGTIRLWTVKFDVFSTGALRLQAFTQSATGFTEVLNQSAGAFPLLGQTRYIKIEFATNGANVDWNIAVETGTPGGLALSGTILGQSVGAPYSMQINPTGALDDAGIGHAILATGEEALFYTTFFEGLYGYAGETIEARMARVDDLAGVTIDVVDAYHDAESSASVTLGVQPTTNPLGVLRDAEQADQGGILRDSLNEVNELVYQTRQDRYSRTPTVTLNYSSGHLSPPLAYTDDDANIWNDVTVSRPDGSSAYTTKETGPLARVDYPTGIGIYQKSLSVNVSTDAVLPSYAGWLLSLGTIDETRFPQITVDLTKNPSLVSAVENIRPGHTIAIENMPAQAGGGGTVYLQVLGWTEFLYAHNRSITFNCAPQSPYDVVVLNDSTFGRLSPSATTTSEALDTTETGVDYTGETWITTASHPSEFPFDIMIGGELMTVTSATGTTFTVTRSVNGVVKSHDSGAAVTLARPIKLAL